jgi:hypothetical protein
MKNIYKLEKNWTQDELWQGCMLVSIAHAIFVADCPELSYENSWDGFSYSTNNSQGSRATISFGKEFFVAGIRNDHYISYETNAISHFEGSSDAEKKFAEEEALQYLLDDVDGETLPSITTAFWGNKNEAFSHHPFDEMIDKGGELFIFQSMDPESAFEAIEEDYALTGEQLALLRNLYYKKIRLSQSDIEAIGATDPEAIEESKIAFAEIGIEWN